MAIYKVTPNQNLFDVALLLYGSIEGLFDLLISNPGLNMTSELTYGQELEYHEEFILNRDIVDAFSAQGIVPASKGRHVYFKHPSGDLIMLIGVNADSNMSSFTASGEGAMTIDWGDNTELERIHLTTSIQTIEHYFDNEVDVRRIRVYGDTNALKIITIDTTNIGGELTLCRPLVVDEYVSIGTTYPLTGLALFDGTYRVNLRHCSISSLLPLGDMDLQELDLTGVRFPNIDVIDDYLFYIASPKHYNDRRPCTVWLTTEPGERGVAAMDTILGEPEWNVSDTWKFYINNELYTPHTGNGTDTK